MYIPLMRALVVVSLAVALSGCRSARPASLAAWDACLVDGHRLEGADPKPGGGGSLLYLHAEWGRSAFVSEYEFGSLMVELPAVVNGEHAPRQGLLREGGQALSFNSSHLEGTVTLRDVTADAARVELHLSATSPDVDLAHGGPRTLDATVTAKRAKALAGCR